LFVLGAVILLIAVRQLGTLRLQIWHIVVAGAGAMLITGSILPRAAVESIDVDVMLFLFGMFVVGRALEDSGALADLSFRLFSRARTVDALVLLILVGAGITSALLLNDTVAIIGVPVAVALARAHRVAPGLALLALAFGVTAGSVVSPIGNPQNLLVALDLEAAGTENPFPTFARWLLLPTIGSIALSYLALRFAYRREFGSRALVHERDAIRDPALARVGRIALGLMLALIVLRVASVSSEAELNVLLTAIAVVPAALVLTASRRRFALVRDIDWPTLAFFAALFIVVEAVDEAGVTTEVVATLGEHVASTPWVLLVSASVSQVVSNVPLVALYLPALAEAGAGTEARMALAAGSTLAGNLTLIGAASNIIVVDSAERRFGERLSFWEFTRVGLPLGMAQLLLTWGCLALL